MAWDAPSYTELAAQIEAAFAAQATEITDLRTGAVITSILRSVAIVAQELSEDYLLRLEDAIVASAMRAFGFPLSSGTKATGTVTMTFTSALGAPLTIPQGVWFQVPSTTIRYLSTAPVTAPAGVGQIDIPIEAEKVGVAYNVPVGTVTQSLSSFVGVSSIRNNKAIVTGADPQTEAEREEAFRRYIQSIHPGTADAVTTGLANATVTDGFGTAIERVGRVQVTESPGQLSIVVDGTTDTASATLVATAQAMVDGGTYAGVTYPGLRAAGVTATVVAAQRVTIPVHIRVRCAQGYAFALVRPLVIDAIQREVDKLSIGAALKVNRLRRAVAALAEVDDFKIEAPAIDQAPANATQVFVVADFEDTTSTNAPTSPHSWVGLL